MEINDVLNAVATDAEHGKLVFSTHAEIALRVQHLLDDPNCSLDTLGKLVSAEPLLAARVLGVANSSACNAGGRPITDLRSAINRLGFTTLRALATSIVVRQMNETPLAEEQRRLAARLWEHTAHVAALARVIAKRLTHQNPDAAFFAGIVHEIGGFYLISRATAFPGLFSSNLEAWCEDGESRVGHAVAHALSIPEHILAAMEVLWSGYLAMPPCSLGDTLLLANELAPVESPFDALSGMSRRDMGAEIELQIDDETLTHVLRESAAEVASLIDALRR